MVSRVEVEDAIPAFVDAQVQIYTEEGTGHDIVRVGVEDGEVRFGFEIHDSGELSWAKQLSLMLPRLVEEVIEENL